ncbi:MAG: hypothetical protein R6V61_00250, partial [Wenzhouxiangellaceae bacterium]
RAGFTGYGRNSFQAGYGGCQTFLPEAGGVTGVILDHFLPAEAVEQTIDYKSASSIVKLFFTPESPHNCVEYRIMFLEMLKQLSLAFLSKPGRRGRDSIDGRFFALGAVASNGVENACSSMAAGRVFLGFRRRIRISSSGRAQRSVSFFLLLKQPGIFAGHDRFPPSRRFQAGIILELRGSATLWAACF